MPETCKICGATTDIEGAFTRGTNSFWPKTSICPECLSKRAIKSSKRSLWISAGIATLGIIVAIISPDDAIGGFFLNLALSIPLCSLLIIPHEVGHALTAKALGMRVFKIIIGSGKTLYSFKLFKMPWEIKKFPFGGLTLALGQSIKFYRLKQFLVVLAGPLISLLFLLVALHFYFKSISHEIILINFYFAFLLSNIITLAISLFPYNSTTAYGMSPNDGLLLLTIPFFSKEKILQQAPFYYSLEALECRYQQQYVEAKRWCEQGLAVYQNNRNLLNVLAITLLDLAEFQKAKEIFADLLQREGLDKNQRALYANNLAYSNILIGRHDLLEEADKCSAQAYQSCPWIPGIKGTRGMVLIELGILDEGILLLKQALAAIEEANAKAMDASYIAIGEMRKGNKQSAQQYFEMAAGFNPYCPLLQRAQDELKK